MRADSLIKVKVVRGFDGTHVGGTVNRTALVRGAIVEATTNGETFVDALGANAGIAHGDHRVVRRARGKFALKRGSSGKRGHRGRHEGGHGHGR